MGSADRRIVRRGDRLAQADLTQRSDTRKIAVVATGRERSFRRTTRYHRINLVFGFLLALFSLTTLLSIEGDRQPPRFDLNLYTDTLGVALFSLFFFVLYLLPETPISRRMQIGTIFLTSAAYKVLLTPYEIGWVLLLAIAVSLMYRYGMLKRDGWRRLFAVVAFSIVATIAAAVIHDYVTLELSINQLAIGVASVFFAYYLFEDDFLKARRARDRLQRESENNRPFVAFGRHAAGVVHDLKNDVNLISAYSTLLSMKQKEEEPLTEEDAKRLARYVERMKGRIDLVRYASASSTQSMEEINVARVCHAASYIFEIRPDYRRAISFRVLLENEELYVYGRRTALLSILENLIGNACEALVDSDGNHLSTVRQVTVAATAVEGSVAISVTDTGKGIPSCRECARDNCLDCGVFRIGHSTKRDGSGLGLFSVQNQVEQLGGSFRIKPSPTGGVVAEVTLPLCSPSYAAVNSISPLLTPR